MTETTVLERAEAVRALEEEFTVLLDRFRRVLIERAEKLSPGMLPGAFKTFTTIVREAPVTASALSEILLADKGQMSRTVRDLEAAGLVERARDPRDRRSSLLSPTAAGLARLHAVRAEHASELVDALAEWEIGEIRELGHLLHALSSGRSPR